MYKCGASGGISQLQGVVENEVDSGQILRDSNEFGFYPKGNRDSLKNFKQGFNMIQFVIY